MANLRGIGKKPALMASGEFDAMAGSISKAALVDALWCACQLGTDESADEIATQAARNIEIALRERGDKIPRDVAGFAAKPLSSDPF